jgi:hypothetical protein
MIIFIAHGSPPGNNTPSCNNKIIESRIAKAASEAILDLVTAEYFLKKIMQEEQLTDM